jgi:hypothetical protein
MSSKAITDDPFDTNFSTGHAEEHANTSQLYSQTRAISMYAVPEGTPLDTSRELAMVRLTLLPILAKRGAS